MFKNKGPYSLNDLYKNQILLVSETLSTVFLDITTEITTFLSFVTPSRLFLTDLTFEPFSVSSWKAKMSGAIRIIRLFTELHYQN